MDLQLGSVESDNKAQTWSLTLLPTEVLHQIFIKLPYVTVLSLRLTNRSLREVIPVSDFYKYRDAEWLFGLEQEAKKRVDEQRLARQKHDDQTPKRGMLRFLRARIGQLRSPRQQYQSPGPSRQSDQDLDEAETTLPCYACFKWLPYKCFTRNMGGISLGCGLACSRICVRCSTRTGVHGVLTGSFGDGYEYRTICVECRRLLMRSHRPFMHPVRNLEQQMRFCNSCVPGEVVARRWSLDWYPQQREWYTQRAGKLFVKTKRKYAEGMQRGKQYRMEKGRRLRLERGKATEEDVAAEMAQLTIDSSVSVGGVADVAALVDAWPRYQPHGD